MVENHQSGLWEPLRRRPVLAGALTILILGVLVFWKLAATEEFMWMDSPDLSNQVLPWWNYQAREWHAGRFPAWEPHQWGGQPLVGQAQPSAVSPLNWLLFLTPLKDGKLRQGYMDAWWILIHAIAAFNAFLLARRLGRSWPASVLAGCAFGYLGYIGNMNWPQMVNGVIWIPLVFLFLIRAVEGYRPWFSAGLAGFFLGLSWLAGHHQAPTFLTYATLALWLYFAWKSPQPRQMLLLTGVFLAIFLAISAPQTFTSYEYGKLAERWVGAKETVDWKTPVPYNVHSVFSLRPAFLFGLFLPNFSEGYTGFVGVTALTLGLLGLLAWRAEPLLRPFAVMSGAAIVVALGAYTPLHGWLYAWAPLFEKARTPAAAIAVFNAAFPVLVAFGFDGLRRAESAPSLTLARRLLTAFAFLIIVIYVMADLSKGVGTIADDRALATAFLALVLALLLGGVIANRVQPAILFGGLLFLFLTEINHTTTYGYNSKDFIRTENFLPVTRLHDDLAAFLRAQKGPVRVWVDDKAIPYNFGDFHGIDAWGGYLASLTLNLKNADVNSAKMQSALGVTHFAGKEPSDPVRQKLVYSGTAGVNIYTNPDPLPRVWTVRTVFPVRNSAEANALLNGEFDLRQEAFVLGAVPKVALPTKNCGEDQIRLARHHGGYVAIQAQATCEGLLILGDTYAPGWRATLDGRATEVYEVNGMLRGVVLPAGLHTVTMDYRPATLTAGAVVAALAIVALALLARWDRPAGRRRAA